MFRFPTQEFFFSSLLCTDWPRRSPILFSRWKGLHGEKTDTDILHFVSRASRALPIHFAIDVLNHSGRKKCVRYSTYALFIGTTRLFSNWSKNSSFMLSVGWKLWLCFTLYFFLYFPSSTFHPFSYFHAYFYLSFFPSPSLSLYSWSHFCLPCLVHFFPLSPCILFLLPSLPSHPYIYLFIRHSCSFFLSYNIDKLWNTNSIDRRRVLCPSCLCTRRWRVGVWRGINAT